MKIIFILGKGGVGKTTISAAIGIGLSQGSKKVFLSSIDPAHNLGDALSLKLSSKPIAVNEFLTAVEANTEEIIKKYLDTTSKKLKTTYRYLSTMNLDKFFDILKHSPGIEEYAILESIKNTLLAEKSKDALIFDTPPTGITKRVLALPKLTLIWLEKLSTIRKSILSKRKMIENVKGEYSAVVGEEVIKLPTSEEKDDIMTELNKYREEMIFVSNSFTSKESTIYVVMLPEELSLFETERIIKFTKEFNISIGGIFLNKVIRMKNPPEEIAGKIKEQEYVISEMKIRFPDVKVREIPLLKNSPRGKDELLELYNNYLKE